MSAIPAREVPVVANSGAWNRNLYSCQVAVGDDVFTYVVEDGVW